MVIVYATCNIKRTETKASPGALQVECNWARIGYFIIRGTKYTAQGHTTTNLGLVGPSSPTCAVSLLFKLNTCWAEQYIPLFVEGKADLQPQLYNIWLIRNSTSFWSTVRSNLLHIFVLHQQRIFDLSLMKNFNFNIEYILE